MTFVQDATEVELCDDVAPLVAVFCAAVGVHVLSEAEVDCPGIERKVEEIKAALCDLVGRLGEL